MPLFDAFRYDGKRVLVVGGATGMGAAAAELALDAGAEVAVMDYADVKEGRISVGSLERLLGTSIRPPLNLHPE